MDIVVTFQFSTFSVFRNMIIKWKSRELNILTFLFYVE